MRRRALHGIAIALTAAAFALPASAWKGQLAKGVIPIETVAELAEKGDPVTIHGQVIWREGDRFYKLRDDTGEMFIRVPEHVRRQWGTPMKHDEVVCAGQYARAYLDDSVWGVHCQRIEITKPGRISPAAPQ